MLLIRALQRLLWLTATLINDEQLLAPKPDVDYKSLPAQPSPQDFLVLTRVKGQVSVGKLCTTSGLGRDKTLQAIETLLRVGLLHVVDESGNAVSPQPIPAVESAPEPEPEPAHEPEPEPEPESAPEPEPAPEPDPVAAAQTEMLDAEVFALGSAPSVPFGDDVEPEDGSTQIVSNLDELLVASGSGADHVEDASTQVVTDLGGLLEMAGGAPSAPPVGAGVVIEEAPYVPPPGDAGPALVADDDIFGLGSTPVPQPEPVVPQPEPEPVVPEPEAPAFESNYDSLNVELDDGDDDLFEMDSPAHLDRVQGRAPVIRDHAASRAKAKTQATEPEAKATPPKQTPPEPAPSTPPQKAKSTPVSTERYRLYPADITTYKSKSPEVPGVDPGMQLEVNFVFDHLAYIDFYQLFGVTPEADRKEIRTAYFEMSKRFHPDKFFRDDVGELAERVEAIFRFVTKGYKTLSKKDKRKDYDNALAHARSQADAASADEDRKRAQAADMLERRAAQFEQQGKFVEAASEFKKVGTLTRSPQALLRAASLLLRANQKLDEAASMARAAVRELPLEVEPRLVLGQIYEKNEMLPEAEKAFGEAEMIAPGDPSVRVHLQRIRSQM